MCSIENQLKSIYLKERITVRQIKHSFWRIETKKIRWYPVRNFRDCLFQLNEKSIAEKYKQSWVSSTECWCSDAVLQMSDWDMGALAKCAYYSIFRSQWFIGWRVDSYCKRFAYGEVFEPKPGARRVSDSTLLCIFVSLYFEL